MDKILLTAFLSALAGFLTAILSIVKLVNEKESKTSEYRQAWTDSARRSLADLVGLINTLASLNWNIARDAGGMTELMTLSVDESNKENADLYKKFLQEKIQDQHARRREVVRELHQTYAMTRLHFKLDDHQFGRIEQSFPHIFSMLESLSFEEDAERRSKLKEKIHAAADELTTFSRLLLKTEWEIVKKGEKAFQQTKRWTIYGSIAMLFILISIGTHAAISMWKENIKNPVERSLPNATDLDPSMRLVEQPHPFGQPLATNALPQPIQINNSASCDLATQQQDKRIPTQSTKKTVASPAECLAK